MTELALPPPTPVRAPRSVSPPTSWRPRRAPKCFGGAGTRSTPRSPPGSSRPSSRRSTAGSAAMRRPGSATSPRRAGSSPSTPTPSPPRGGPRMFPVEPARDPNGYRLADDRHRHGPLSIAVPGVLGGLLTMLGTWGTLDRKMIMAPAIRAARDGVRLIPPHAHTWRTIEARAEGRPAPISVTPRARADAPAGRHAGGDRQRGPGHLLLRADRPGDRRPRPQAGRPADPRRHGGYRARVVEPVSVEVRGHTLSTPPPASGGLTSLQIVALFDRLERRGRAGPAGDPRAFEAFLEAAKAAWEERLTRLGDPPAMTVARRDLLTAAPPRRTARTGAGGAGPPWPGRLIAPDPLRGTVHLAAADAAGNVVSWTQTHGGGFGSMVMVPGTGIVLGHGMSRFEPRPGWVNSIAPGRRPLHNMAPVVAIAGGRAVLAVGASGGRTIVNDGAAVLINRLILGLDPGDAVAAPRLQCETIEPAVIESAAGIECLATLRAHGHALTVVPRDAGNAHLIARDGECGSACPSPAWPARLPPGPARTDMYTVRPPAGFVRRKAADARLGMRGLSRSRHRAWRLARESVPSRPLPDSDGVDPRCARR